jgi:predicted MFS family arabinose efflux permease
MRSATICGMGTGERRARGAVFCAYGVQGTMFASLVTRVPTLQDRFGLSDGALGVLLLLVPVVAGLGSVLAGWLSSRYGSAIVLRAAQPAVCVLVAVVGAMPRFGPFLVALFAFALALGMVDALAGIQGVLLEQRYGRSIMHGFFSAWSLAGIAGAGITSLTNHYDLSLGWALAIVAAAGIAVAAYTGRWLLHGRPDPSDAGTGRAAAIPWRPIVLVGLVVAFMYVADAATSNFSAHYLQNALHSSDTVGPLAYAFYQAAMVLGRASADRLVSRFGPVRTVRTGGVVALAGVTLATLAPNPWLAIAGFFVLGIGLCPVAPQGFTAAGVLDPAGTGVAVARINLFNYAGFVVGAPLIGIVSEAATERIAFGLLLFFALGIVLLAGAFDSARLVAETGPAVPAAAAADPAAVD